MITKLKNTQKNPRERVSSLAKGRLLALREKSALGAGFFDIVLLSFQSPPFVDCPVKQLSGERNMIDDGAQIMRELLCHFKFNTQ